MKLLFIISLLLSLYGECQMMNGSRFIYSALTTGTPQTYTNAGTVVINRQSFHNTNTGVTNGNGLTIEGTGNITIKNCLFYSNARKAIGFIGFTGTVTIENCLFVSNETDIEYYQSPGILTLRNNWSINPYGARRCQGQFIQFEESSCPGSIVENNKLESFRGEGYTEDWISLYVTNGSSGNPVTVRNNKARGGGPSESGGGFMFGDTGGSWQLSENNKLVNPGNYILAASGGQNITIQNNQGYQDNYTWTNIAMYAYDVADPGTCSDITVTGNDMYVSNANYWYAPGGAESCGTISGSSFTGIGNFTDLTLSEMNFPTDLIDCVSQDILWRLRDESVQFRNLTETCVIGSWAADLPRPTSNAGADDSDTGSAYTLVGSGSGGSGALSYKWVQVSGPNVATMTAPTSTSNVLNGLVPGVYEFRLEVYDADGASDGDWVTLTMN